MFLAQQRTQQHALVQMGECLAEGHLERLALLAPLPACITPAKT